MSFLWCQTQPFPRISGNTTLPELFNPCLTFGLLPTLPLGLVILALVSVVVSAQFYTNRSLNMWSNSTRLKLIVSITSTACAAFASLLCTVFKHTLLRERQVYELFDALFCIIAIGTHWLSLKYGYVSSGILHGSWLLRLCSLVPVNYYLFYDAFFYMNILNVVLLVFGLVELVCSLGQVILLIYPDNSQQSGDYQRLDNEQPSSPFQTSSFVQNLTLSYAGSMLRKSFKEKVTCDDFWKLEERDQATNIRKITSTYTGTNNSLWSLIWLMLRVSWVHNFKATLSMSVTVVARYLYYTFLSAILEFCGGDYPPWLAIFPAIGLILTDLCKNLALMQLYLHGSLTFYNIRTAMTTLIYDKMLRLSPSAQTNTATGVIINYITVDVVHSRKFWGQLNDFIYCPSVMIISMILLISQVGLHNMAYGLGVLVFCQCISLLLTRLDAKYTDSQMKHKDERLKLINDILNGIRVLKLYGWEPSMQKIVGKIRALEVKEILKIEIVSAFVEASYDTAPFLAILVTLYGYVVIDGERLTPKSAFVTLFLFDLIRYAIYKIPRLVTDTVTTVISLRRVNNFLNEPEREERQLLPPANDYDFVVELSKASFSWIGSPELTNLSNVSMSVRPGQLVAVMGQVASGKSTLLSAIAGELPPFMGSVQLRSTRMAYVPQQAWIQNMTVRDNILFDGDFNEDLYEKTLDACALRDDIQLLPGGDLTEIGEKGINLSGGQKARVSLARAVYQQADFYILDDPLSAVDSHVGKQIFTNVIAHGGLLDGKTRIVSVNSSTYLNQFDLIICLKGGKVTYCGPYSGLTNQSSSSLISQVSSMESSQTASEGDDEAEKPKQRKIADEEYERDSLIEEESFRAGRVSSGMYATYIKEFGVILCILFSLSLFVGSTTARMLSNLSMAKWSGTAFNKTSEESLHSLIVFGAYGLAADIFFVISFFLIGVGCYRASTAFHKQLIGSIIRAPMSFFDKTPLGRIMNRFSMDIEIMDSELCQSYGYLFLLLAEVIRQFLTIFVAMPVMIPAIFPLVILCVFVSRYFNAASAQFRRIASNSMSTVCSSVQDAYCGASSIRVFDVMQRFRNQFARNLDHTVESNSVEVIANCWVQVRMDMATNATVVVILLSAIWFSNNEWITLGLFGMIVNSSVLLGGLFGESTQAYRDAETEVVCVERIKEYITLENEPIWKDNVRAQPADSSVEFQDVSLRYREQDEPVIHKVSFKVESGQRIGIVGRTGAGKTSLTSLLFRLVEPYEGCIRIGSTDIKHLGPTLRRILTIIPQDPVLFCGTLRSNLDPFEEFTDEQLRNALEKAHLSEFINSLVEGLSYEIADGGQNLSVGQRQLICLARALLRASKILVMDEATSSVDPETDQLIQQTIRENFTTSTILTIAHRLNTVLDYDKILVMQAGKVVEFDNPQTLLANPDSLFFSYAKMAGLVC